MVMACGPGALRIVSRWLWPRHERYSGQAHLHALDLHNLAMIIITGVGVYTFVDGDTYEGGWMCGKLGVCHSPAYRPPPDFLSYSNLLSLALSSSFPLSWPLI